MKHLRKSLWALALLVPILSQGQERLEPYAFNMGFDHTRMEKLLDPGYNFFYMRCPSFGAESALSMRRVERLNGGALLTYSVAEENIWYAKKRKRVKVTKSEMHIPDSVAWHLQNVFNNAINTASYWADNRGILDGIGYYFGRRYAAGEVHSPEKGSRIQRLVAAMDSIGFAVVHKDTTLLLRQLPLIDSIDRCFRKDYPQEAFHPDYKPGTYTDSTGVMHLQLYRSATFLDIVVADSADAVAQTTSMLDFFQQLAHEIFIRYHDGVKLSVLVNPSCTEPRCKVKYDPSSYIYDYYKDRTYYTLYLPPSMLSMERCIGILKMSEGTHPIH